MSHKIAEAKKLGLSGRAADRFGHGGFQSKDPATGSIVGTPPSARKVFHRFETPKTREKIDSFLTLRESQREEQRRIDATLATQERIRRRDFGVASDLATSFRIDPQQDTNRLLRLAQKKQDEIKKDELAKARASIDLARRLDAQDLIPKVVPTPTPTPIPELIVPSVDTRKPQTFEEIKARYELLRASDAQFRSFLPDAPKTILQKQISAAINNEVPEPLQDAVGGEVNLRQSKGESVSPGDIKNIAVQVDPIINTQFNKYFSDMDAVVDQSDTKYFEDKEINEDIAKRSFSGEVLSRDIVNTPGKELIELIFARAGKLMRDPSIATTFVDLEEGERLPLDRPEEFLVALDKDVTLNLEDAMVHARGELQREIKELSVLEGNRLFTEKMKEFKGGGEIDVSTMEQVKDKWSLALNGADTDSLTIEQRLDLADLLFDARGKEGLSSSSRKAVIRMLDLIDPEALPEESREDFVTMVKRMAKGEQGLKIEGVPIISTELELFTLIFSTWKWPAYTALGYVGAELGSRAAEEVGVPPIVGGLVGALALGVVGGPKLTRLTNSLRVEAASKLRPGVIQRGILPPDRAAKLTAKQLTAIEKEELELRKALRGNVQDVDDVTATRLGKLVKEGETRVIAQEVEQIARDKLASIEALRASPTRKVSEAIVTTAKKTEARQEKARLRADSLAEQLEESMARFIGRTARAIHTTITGEAPVVEALRTAAKKLNPLKVGERRTLTSLQKVVDAKKPVAFTSKEEFTLNAFKKQERNLEFQVTDRPQKYINLLNKEKRIAQGAIEGLSQKDEVLYAELSARADAEAARAVQITKAEAALEEALTPHAKSLIIKIAQVAEQRAVKVPVKKIKLVSRDALIKAHKDNNIPWRRGASVADLSESLLAHAKVVARIRRGFLKPGAEGTKPAVVKSLEALNRRIAKVRQNLDKERVKMTEIVEESDVVKSFNAAIDTLEDRVRNPRVWGASESVESFRNEKLATLVRRLDASDDMLEVFALQKKMANQKANLGFAQKGTSQAKKTARWLLGHSVVVDDADETARIIQAAITRETIMETTRIRGKAFLSLVEDIMEEIGVRGNEAKFYTGPKLGTAKHKFVHDTRSVISHPELYAKLSEQQLEVVAMVQQSVDDNLLIPERIFGVGTKTLDETFIQQGKGLTTTFEGFPVQGFGGRISYWPQYLDAKHMEILTGEKVVGTPRSSLSRQKAFLKTRKYDDIFDLWNDLIANSEKPVRLMNSRASMEARFAASGEAMGTTTYKDSIIRNLPNSTKKGGEELMTSIVEGFGNHHFTADVANAVRTQMEVMAGNIPARGFRNGLNLIRNTKLALDLSAALGIQGYFFASVAFTRPTAIPRHVRLASKFAFNSKAFDQWIAMKAPEIAKMQSKGLVLGINPMDLQKVTRHSMGFGKVNLVGRLADTINSATFGRMVTYYKVSIAEQYLDIMRHSRAYRGFAKLVDSVPNIRKTLGLGGSGALNMSDEAIERAVMTSVNNRFGGISQAMIGKGSTRILMEQMLDIAPNWLRARANIYTNLFKGNTAERYLALNMIGRELATAAVFSTVMSELLVGELPNLTDPTKFDWLAIKTPLGTLPVIPSAAIMNLLANAGYLLSKGAFDIGTGEDPLEVFNNTGANIWSKTLRKIKGRESPALGIIIEQATGKDFYGNKISGWDERLTKALLGAVPIFGEDIYESIDRGDSITDVLTRGAIGFGGFSLYPKSAFEIVKEVDNTLSRLLFGDATDFTGELRYGPEVVYEDLDQVDRDTVQKQEESIEAHARADELAEDLSLNSAFDSDEYKEKKENLSKTGTLPNGERIHFTTQAEDDKHFENGDLDGRQWIPNHFEKMGDEALLAKSFREDLGMEFAEQEPVNEVDRTMLAYWELDIDSPLYRHPVTGEKDSDAFRQEKDRLFNLAVGAGLQSGGQDKARKVALILRPLADSGTVRRFQKAERVKNEVESMPKYRFLTVEQSEQVDSVTEMAIGLGRIFREMGRRNVTVAKILYAISKSGLIDETVGTVAFMRQIPVISHLLWNPDRDALVMENPFAVRFYPILYENMGETNKIVFRKAYENKYFSKVWLREEEEELSRPDIFRGLDIAI